MKPAIVIDIDGVILRNRVEIIPNTKNAIDRLREKYRIILHTSRYQCDRKRTMATLREYGIKYDRIVFGKPIGEFYIDDKALIFKDWKTICKKLS